MNLFPWSDIGFFFFHQLSVPHYCSNKLHQQHNTQHGQYNKHPYVVSFGSYKIEMDHVHAGAR